MAGRSISVEMHENNRGRKQHIDPPQRVDAQEGKDVCLRLYSELDCERAIALLWWSRLRKEVRHSSETLRPSRKNPKLGKFQWCVRCTQNANFLHK
jgi:hypothetical protein